MNTLENEIIEKFRLLPPEGRVRVLSTLQEEVAPKQESLLDWLREIEALGMILHPDASGHVPTAAELINEVREELDARHF